MYSPEKSQLEICLLKCSLEEIENELIVQRSSCSKFDSENEQKFHETLNAVKASRALSLEIQMVNQENMRLVAKRMHLKAQIEELAKAQEKAREEYSAMEKSSSSEKQEIELLTRKYEDSLREKADRFRETSAFFSETEMNREIEKVNSQICDLEKGEDSRRSQLEVAKRQLEELTPAIPDNILVILGKNDLDDKISSLSKLYEQMEEKRNELINTLKHSPS